MYVCSVDERFLLSLPSRMGGMSIPVFSRIAPHELSNSRKVTKQLVTNILQQESKLVLNLDELRKQKLEIKEERQKRHNEDLLALKEKMTPDQLRALELSAMKGASAWLTTQPLESENFTLTKREFFDAVRLRYRWHLKFLPQTCPCSKE